MRSHLRKWGAVAYVVASLAALTWLSVATASAQAFHAKALTSQVTLLSNALQGTMDNLENASESGATSTEEAERLLVSAEASLAQVEILALGYEQITDHQLAVRSLAGFYHLQVRLIREDAGRASTLTPEHRTKLKAIRSDLALIASLCQADLLTQGDQDEIAKRFAATATALSVPEANSVLSQNNPKP